jgi:reactive intermediate/imine deaminase
MNVQRLNPPGLSQPLSAYCLVARKGSIVTTAGAIALDAEGNVVGEGDIEAQTRQTIGNLQAALEGAGASLQDILKTTIFITDMANYQGMNKVYAEYFQDHPPARSTVRADLVLPQLLVEIEAIAVLD